MSRESELLFEVWEKVRDVIPPKGSLRADAAMEIIRCFADYGFDAKDLRAATEEDRYLAKAFPLVFEEEEDADEEEGDYY